MKFYGQSLAESDMLVMGVCSFTIWKGNNRDDDTMKLHDCGLQAIDSTLILLRDRTDWQPVYRRRQPLHEFGVEYIVE